MYSWHRHTLGTPSVKDILSYVGHTLVESLQQISLYILYI